MLTKLHTPYNKFIIALLGAVLGVVAQFYGENGTVQAVIAVATALGVFQVPNREVK